VTWTLAIEVQFYVLAALVIYLLPLWSVGPFCIAVMIGAEALRQHLGVDHATMVLTQTRIDGPFAGVFAAWLWRSAALRVFVARHGAGLCSAAVALYAAYYVAYTYALARMPITSFAANAILFGFLVIAFTGDDAKPRHAIVRFTRWCGVRCYAIYLFHVGVLGIVSHLMFNWPPNVFPPGAGWPAVVGAALLTFVLVTLSWHYLEKPIMIWAAKLVPRRQAAEMIGSQIDVVTGRPSFPLMSVQGSDSEQTRPKAGDEDGGARSGVVVRHLQEHLPHIDHPQLAVPVLLQKPKLLGGDLIALVCELEFLLAVNAAGQRTRRFLGA